MFSRRKPSVPGRIDTLVGPQTVLQGDLAFAGGLHIDGRIVGRVHPSAAGAEATLWIGEQGSVEGRVEAQQVVIHGAVKGDVHGHERVVLGATAR
ncbi:MAG: polymer-forming cytoskeletal protein, partial [Gammaproteobacteria bacterium]